MSYATVDDLPPHLRDQARAQLGTPSPSLDTALASMRPDVAARLRKAHGAKQANASKGACHADKLENPFAEQMRVAGLPTPTREHVFAKPRRFRFDFCWPDKMVAAEIEGGIWTNGAHTRGKHYESDCTKYNLATSLGWRVYRFTGGMVKDGRALIAITTALECA